jgi:riboflavin synthase
MFNGIIYNQGTISKIVKRDKGLNIFVKSNLKVSSRDMGLSVACDGVCLTLISFKKKIWNFIFQMKLSSDQSLNF